DRTSGHGRVGSGLPSERRGRADVHAAQIDVGTTSTEDTMTNETLMAMHSLLDLAAKNVGNAVMTKRDKLSSLTDVIADIVVAGGIIVPASEQVLQMLRAGNRIVSFIL